ncbi:MAG TPA: hypothetical protein ENN03_00585 [bacterium]|nr:hypothetical protein [bacterium]
MKKCLVVLLALLMFTSLAAGEEKMTTADNLRIGLGAAIGKEILPYSMGSGFVFKMVDFPSFYIPIIIASNFRVEPFFGFYNLKFEEGDDWESLNYMEYGAGLFFMKWFGPVDLYGGVRFGFFFSKMAGEYNDSESSWSRNDLFVGPALGGEYFFTRHLSLGGEVQFIYTKWGDEKYEPSSPNGSDDLTVTEMKTKTLFFIRWYMK